MAISLVQMMTSGKSNLPLDVTQTTIPRSLVDLCLDVRMGEDPTRGRGTVQYKTVQDFEKKMGYIGGLTRIFLREGRAGQQPWIRRALADVQAHEHLLNAKERKRIEGHRHTIESLLDGYEEWTTVRDELERRDDAIDPHLEEMSESLYGPMQGCTGRALKCALAAMEALGTPSGYSGPYEDLVEKMESNSEKKVQWALEDTLEDTMDNFDRLYALAEGHETQKVMGLYLKQLIDLPRPHMQVVERARAFALEREALIPEEYVCQDESFCDEYMAKRLPEPSRWARYWESDLNKNLLRIFFSLLLWPKHQVREDLEGNYSAYSNILLNRVKPDKVERLTQNLPTDTVRKAVERTLYCYPEGVPHSQMRPLIDAFDRYQKGRQWTFLFPCP